MKQYKHIVGTLALAFGMAASAFAGNPDRQGEAGAYELTINPWARGVVFVNCSKAVGVEATYLNPAGVGRIMGSSELLISRTNYLQGTGIGINAGGFAMKLNENSAFGISLMSMDFGDIQVTTTDLPEGTGGTFSPSFINIGATYSYTFEKHLSVGITARSVSETTSNLTAGGLALDAGVLYTTGVKNNIHFAVALKNVGTPMKFSGDGLAYLGGVQQSAGKSLTIDMRAAQFEMPSSLNIGGAYDWYLDQQNKLTIGANFMANSFSRDQLTGSLEYSFRNMFMARVGYNAPTEAYAVNETLPVHTGLSAGISLLVPVKKESDTGVGIDYAFRQTARFGGSHTLGLRLTF
jgi:hypothetical protein